MQINHNIRAMVTQHALYQNNTAMSKSLEKLSTGLRINRAQDDAAGLAMSEQMRTQIRGLGKAKQNSQDGQAALQIAEGGLAEVTNLLQRQRELAVQAANDTLTSTERLYLDDEFQELSKEIGRIALTTDYNGKNLLSNGTFGGNSNVALNSNNSFGAANTDGVAQSWTLHVGPNYSTNVGGQFSNQTTVTYYSVVFGAANSAQVGGKAWTTDNDLRNFTLGKFGESTLNNSGKLVNFNTLSICGANAARGVTSNQGIYDTIDALDGAIKSISAARAKIGTFINRLEYTINNTGNMEFNTQEAESRIRDTNFATATTDFTKNQIMVQSATSILAQANALPQSVLGLLG